jgi:CheY-like chemotaxis protein
MRVLIADDNARIRSAIRLVLEELDGRVVPEAPCGTAPTPARCTVLEAADAAEAVTQLTGHEVDVVLLDWELPGLEAVHVVDEIKKRCPDSTVIAMSGDPEARRSSLRLGADHFVSKNDPPAKLLELLGL